MVLKRVLKYSGEVRHEIKRVTWTTRQDVIFSTIIACILAFVCSIFLFGVDQAVMGILSLVTGPVDHV